MIAATAITNVRVFDGERLREPATVVLEDATISARTSADSALNADVVDGGGGTLLPGLIDTHVHVDKVSQLEASASWGVTTMLDMGNKDLANLTMLKNGQGLPTLRSAGNPASAPLAGTDSNDDLTAPYQVAHGESLHEELARLAGSGLAPAEALRGATSLAADTFGLTDRGVIAPGRRADLVLVDGGPHAGHRGYPEHPRRVDRWPPGEVAPTIARPEPYGRTMNLRPRANGTP